LKRKEPWSPKEKRPLTSTVNSLQDMFPNKAGNEAKNEGNLKIKEKWNDQTLPCEEKQGKK